MIVLAASLAIRGRRHTYRLMTMRKSSRVRVF
jgi:hypothetical protein